MRIDWFTFVAQIFNFILLVYLLKRFLYRPVLDAIQRREEGVRARLEDARRKDEAAAEEEARFRALQKELEGTRLDVLQAAENEAEARRQELTAEVRDEVRALREEWHESLRRQREAFLEELRRRMSRELYDMVERVLDDLSGADVGDRLLQVFLDRLPEADDTERHALLDAVAEDGWTARLRSSFPLSKAQKERLRAGIVSWLGDEVDVAWHEDPDLTLGIELQAGDRKIAWSVDDYLDTLESETSRLLEAETR